MKWLFSPHSPEVNMLTQQEKERYHRHLRIPEIGESGQNKLKSGKVLIIGLGGLGSPAALYLAAAGVGTIGLLDMDKVESSNLQRQILYNTRDIGRSKAVCAAEHLSLLNPNVQFITHDLKLGPKNALEIIQGYDVILDGTDNFSTRYLVNDACVLLDKPFVYGSIQRFEGQVSFFNALLADGKRGPTYRCLFPVPPAPGTIGNCSELGVLGSLPGLIGTLQATEVIKYLTQTGSLLSGKLFHFNMLSMENYQIELDRTSDWGNGFPENAHAFETKDYELFCGLKDTDTPVRSISVESLKKLFNDRDSFQLIDVREENEWPLVNGWADINIPLGEVLANISSVSTDKPVVLFCKGGTRSKMAIRRILAVKPMNNLFSLDGGILAWLENEKQIL